MMNNRFKRIDSKKRRGVKPNSGGNHSTNMMRREYIPDRGWVVFPMTTEGDWYPIFEEAERLGQVYDFGQDVDAAIKFADEGDWKKKYGGIPDFSYSNKELHYKFGGKIYRNPYVKANTRFDVDTTFKRIPRAKYGKTEPEINPHSESNPTDRNAQHQLNKFIMTYVIPEYGGTVKLWKEILNEISYHESGALVRFDKNAVQISSDSFTGLYEGPGRSFAQMEEESAKTALNKLFNEHHADLWDHMYDRNTETFRGAEFLTSMGDTITYSDFPELEKLYYSQRKIKSTSNPKYSKEYPDLDKNVVVGWDGGGEPFDLRDVSNESKGILMLMQILGTHERQRDYGKTPPKFSPSDYFVTNVDEHGEEFYDLVDADTRTEIWANLYHTRADKIKQQGFLADIQDYTLNYNDSKGVVSGWSMPEGSSGGWDKSTPIINLTPFYSHDEDMYQNYDEVTDS